jgi:large subunit ribosomal protein L25
MENVIMKVQVREGTGKGAARKLRASGKVPGVLYGQGMKSLPLMADEKELWDLVNSISIENTLVDLMVEGYRKKPLKTIIREVQLHHYKSRIVHVDFFQVSLKKKIYVEIPLILTGKPEGVRSQSGILEHHLRNVSMNCLPTDIPEKIEIDVSGLMIGDSVRVKDVSVANAEILNDPEQPIATVIPPTVMKEPEPAVAAAAEGEEAEEGEAAPEEAEGEKEAAEEASADTEKE